MSSAPSLSPAHRRASSDELLALWRRHRATGDRAVRDRLVLTLAPLVKHIVYRKAREMPAHCEIEDLISCGLEALMRSIGRFDPTHGATLEQYAWTRIHGAVLDELRRLDWAPRSVRRWERDMNRAAQEFVALHGRPATTDELAQTLAISREELQRRRNDVVQSDVTSLNGLVTVDGESGIERIDTLVAHDARLDPEHAAHVADAKERFRAAFTQLAEREREVVVLLYVKGLTMAQTGSVLGVTESRISQLHSAIKRKLRAALEQHQELVGLVA